MSKYAAPLRALRPGLWVLFYLSMLDVAVNLLFPYPKDLQDVSPGKIRQYFEYGRSTEGKYRRMTRLTAAESAPIVSSGWLEANDRFATPIGSKSPGAPVVTVYGMSHAGLLAADLAKCDPSLAVRFVGAPGAVPTWSYTAYLRDRAQVYSEVVILAVMTVGVPMVCTTTGGTMYFEFGYPYTYPRYYLQDGELTALAPPFMSGEGFRKALFDPRLWRGYVDWLRVHDKFYDPLLFTGSILDGSATMRLLRRAYATTSQRAEQSGVYDAAAGFNGKSEEARVLGAILVNFASRARHDGSFPVVYLVNNQGTGGHLFALLQPMLAAHRIAYLSSHEICSPGDPRNYLPDSHFEPAVNMRIASAMARLVHERRTP